MQKFSQGGVDLKEKWILAPSSWLWRWPKANRSRWEWVWPQISPEKKLGENELPVFSNGCWLFHKYLGRNVGRCSKHSYCIPPSHSHTWDTLCFLEGSYPQSASHRIPVPSLVERFIPLPGFQESWPFASKPVFSTAITLYPATFCLLWVRGGMGGTV